MVGEESDAPSDVGLTEKNEISENEVTNIQREEDVRVGRKGVFCSQTALLYRRGVANGSHCVSSLWVPWYHREKKLKKSSGFRGTAFGAC